MDSLFLNITWFLFALFILFLVVRDSFDVLKNPLASDGRLVASIYYLICALFCFFILVIAFLDSLNVTSFFIIEAPLC